MKYSYNKAFTLIELLIVIGIMGILLTMGALNYSNTLKRSRDERRKVNVATIRSNLELFRSSDVNNQYPAGIIQYIIRGYTLPEDPQSKSINVYTYSGRSASGGSCGIAPNYCVTYTLSTPLELLGSRYEVTPNSERIIP